MKHIMLDLETLGTTPGSTVLSIGAVEFEPGRPELGPEFYIEVSRYSCMMRGLSENGETLSWWMDQKEEARALLTRCADAYNTPTLPQALLAFNQYLFALAPPRDLRIYGNGADFDQPILAAAYAAAGMNYPVHFNNRCYRQLKSLDELFGPAFSPPEKVREGIYHNALDDAKTQARHLLAIIEKVKGAVNV